jgi:hypothetical protein
VKDCRGEEKDISHAGSDFLAHVEIPGPIVRIGRVETALGDTDRLALTVCSWSPGGERCGGDGGFLIA